MKKFTYSAIAFTICLLTLPLSAAMAFLAILIRYAMKAEQHFINKARTC